MADRSIANPVDMAAFPAAPASTFWSSSPYVVGSSYTYLVNFDGSASYYDPVIPFAVRLVRDGP